jgi:MFS transporter, DHA2 family, multidrug resistance protein
MWRETSLVQRCQWAGGETDGSTRSKRCLLTVLRQRATEHPLLDVLAFRNRRLGSSVAALLMVHFAMTGFLFMLSPYLQAVLDNSSFGTGVRMLPVVLAVMVGAGTAERLAPRVGPRGPVTAGLLLLGGGLLIFSTTGVDLSDTFVALAQLPLGLGIGLTLAIAMHTALSTAPDEKSGEASGATSAFRQVGTPPGLRVPGRSVSRRLRPQRRTRPRGPSRAACRGT